MQDNEAKIGRDKQIGLMGRDKQIGLMGRDKHIDG